MSLAIDALIIIIAVAAIWTASKKGFIRSVMGLVTTVASLIAAWAWTPKLSVYLKEKFLLSPISEGIADSLRSLSRDTSTDLYNFDKLAESLPQPLTDLLDRYGMHVEDFVERAKGIFGGTEETVTKLARDIAEPTASLISDIVGFVLLFVAAIIVLSIVTALLDLIFKLPVLKTANSLLGFVFGVIQAAIYVSLFAVAAEQLVGALEAVDPSLFNESTIGDTIICKFLTENNLFTLLKLN